MMADLLNGAQAAVMEVWNSVHPATIDMLILAVPVLIVALWGVCLLLLMLRRWKGAAVVLVASVTLNVWTEQIPINAVHWMKRTLTPAEQRWPAVKEPGNIRILSYNICGKVEYAPLHGQEFIDWMLGVDADIVFLPENNPDTAPPFDEAMKAHYPYYLEQFVKKGEWLGEHTIYSRYPLINGRLYKMDVEKLLEEHPLIDEDMAWRVGKNPLIYEAEAVIGGDTVTLMHVHLRSNSFDRAKAEGNRKREKVHNVYDNLLFGYEFRRAETQMIMDSLARRPYPVIIAGDFNDLSGSRTLNTLQNSRMKNMCGAPRERLKDAWWEKGTGLGFTFVDQHLWLRLDHVLYSSEYELVDVEVPEVPYSDHRPVLVELRGR